MKKVNVTICTGQHCCKTEAAWFKQFDRILCEKIKSQIEIVGANCPGNCPAARSTSTPHVMVNSQPIPNATPLEVIRTIRSYLRTGTLTQPLVA
jgi:NADH:ubiquinone oxidoreductase subunit E